MNSSIIYHRYYVSKKQKTSFVGQSQDEEKTRLSRLTIVFGFSFRFSGGFPRAPRGKSQDWDGKMCYGEEWGNKELETHLNSTLDPRNVKHAEINRNTPWKPLGTPHDPIEKTGETMTAFAFSWCYGCGSFSKFSNNFSNARELQHIFEHLS